MKYPPLTFITDLEALARALEATCDQEARLRSVEEAEVRAERRRWLERGQPTALFLRMWRHINGIDVASFSRLTGMSTAAIRKGLRMSDVRGTLEPVTGKVLVSIKAALDAGFSFAEIERARKGEHVWLWRFCYEQHPKCA